MNLLWLRSGGCGGCSMSLLCADTADFAGQLGRGHPAAVASVAVAGQRGGCGRAARQPAGRPDRAGCTVRRGALLRGPDGTGRFHLLAGTGVPMIDWVRRLAGVGAVVAVVPARPGAA